MFLPQCLKCSSQPLPQSSPFKTSHQSQCQSYPSQYSEQRVEAICDSSFSNRVHAVHQQVILFLSSKQCLNPTLLTSLLPAYQTVLSSPIHFELKARITFLKFMPQLAFKALGMMVLLKGHQLVLSENYSPWCILLQQITLHSSFPFLKNFLNIAKLKISLPLQMPLRKC